MFSFVNRWLAKYKQFQKKRFERSVAKHLKLVQNPKAVREERVGAIEYFSSLTECKIAVPSLLKRFDYSLDHGINDTREKEACMKGVIQFKEQALPYIKTHLLMTSRIAWPIKTFSAIGTEEQLVAALQECLDFSDVSFNQMKVDKNYDVLCYLRDHKLPDGGLSLLPFVANHDERVRFAVVEAILAQKNQAAAAEMEDLLLNESEENTRIRQSMIEAYVENKWAVHLKEKIQPGTLCPGVRVTASYRLEAF
ncbi:MAG: hypothetical protein KA436_00915 [Oligoflexales bacterium]|nr:hypothetical protein [Oligoflexales bacterium]